MIDVTGAADDHHRTGEAGQVLEIDLVLVLVLVLELLLRRRLGRELAPGAPLVIGGDGEARRRTLRFLLLALLVGHAAESLVAMRSYAG
ncbi:MAG: hypothetical protein R2705_06685 [Ilumatobacteraceae bacterium]